MSDCLTDCASDMASFQWNISRSKFVAKMKDKLADGDCMYPRTLSDANGADEYADEKIQQFELSQDRGNPDSEIFPPPTFTNTVIPHTYK